VTPISINHGGQPLYRYYGAKPFRFSVGDRQEWDRNNRIDYFREFEEGFTMFVRDHMTTNPVTIPKEMSILEALRLMQEHKISNLPVVHRDKLVGIVTERDLLRASPSPMTSLSFFEVNYLISKMTVKEIMIKKPAVVAPNTTIEEATLVMQKHNVGGLPVMEGDKLVGMIAERDLFESLIKLFGLQRPGARITLEVEDRVGILAQASQIIKEHDVNIISVANHPTQEGNMVHLVLRLDVGNVEAIVTEIGRASCRERV
jgi:acetoin utilization protein AcuB